ncbi:MAG: hypothetical protein RLZZ480_466 [Candidatus Parcubacteria bacterium]|jgi:hypothetical protein
MSGAKNVKKNSACALFFSFLKRSHVFCSFPRAENRRAGAASSYERSELETCAGAGLNTLSNLRHCRPSYVAQNLNNSHARKKPPLRAAFCFYSIAQTFPGQAGLYSGIAMTPLLKR